jgi:hypothetical protein
MPEKIKSVVISLDGQKEAYRSGDNDNRRYLTWDEVQ